MTEPEVHPPAAGVGAAPTATSAGALLRAARERQGLHIAALAASIKVAPRKLEALERDDLSAMPDNAFARALAQSVCRVLKTDPVPVLALMPPAGPASLDGVSSGINAPFRDRSGPGGERWFAVLARRPLVWGGAALLLAALAVALLPPGLWQRGNPVVPGAPVVERPASTPEAAVPAPPPPPVVETVHSVPLAEAASAPAGGALRLSADKPSWVQVVDAGGQVLLARTVQAGETLGLDGAPPLRVTVGNAAATTLTYQGKPVDLISAARDNIARLQLP